MAELTEGKHPGEFIASEANGSLSRETVTILSGENVVAGEVLGKVTKGAASAAAAAGNTGDGAMGAITVAAGAKAGDYVLTVIEPGTNVGDFIVEDPDGINVGAGDVASAFSGGGLSFTLADGDADFVAGDSIVITVAAGSGKYAAYDQDATDGREVAAGIAYGNYDASAADLSGVAVVRDAEVNAGELTWPSDITADEKTAAIADLAVNYVLVRN